MAGESLGSVFVDVEARTDGLGKSIGDGVGKHADKAGKSFGSKLMAGAGKTLKVGAIATGTAVGSVLAVAFTKGFSRLKGIEEAQAKLTGLGHSAKTVEGIMTNATNAVTGTAYGLDAAASVAASAVAAGIKPGRDLERTLTLVADAATIAGTDMGSMGAIFNKVAAANKVQMDVINQLHDQGVPALALLAAEMGVTAEEATKMASSGQIDFATFQRAMEMGMGGGEQAAKNLAKTMGISVEEVKKQVKSGEISADQWAAAIKDVGGAAQQSGKTFSGAMANMGAALGRFGAKVLGGVFSEMPDVFAGLNKVVDDFSAKWGDKIGKEIGEFFSQAVETIKTAVTNIKTALVDLSETESFQRLVDAAQSFVSHLQAASDSVGPIIDSIMGYLKPVAEIALGAAIEGFTVALELAGPAVEGVAGALETLLGWLEDNEEAAGIIAGVITVTLLPALVAWGKQAVVTMWQNVTMWVTTKVEAIKSAVIQVAQAWKVVGAWILMGLRATGTAALYGAAFAFMAAAAVKNALIQAAQAARVVLANALITAGFIAQRAALIAGAVAAKAMAAAQWLLNAAMSANPITLIIIAVVALVAAFVLLWTKSEGFRNVVIAGWNAIKDAAVAVFTAIGEFLSAVWDGIKTTFETVFGAIWDAVTFYFETYKTIITTVFNFVWSFIQTIWNTITAVISGALSGISAVFTRITSTIKSVWSGAWNAIKNTAESVWGKITGFFSGAKAKMKGIFEGIGDAIKNALKSAFNGVSSIWNSTVGKLSFKAPDWVPGFGGKGWSMPKMPTYAMGTNFHPGGWAMVGERGPEIVNLPRGSSVKTADESARLLGQGGPNISYGNINVTLAVDDLDKIGKIGEFLDMLDRARVDSRRTLRSGTVMA